MESVLKVASMIASGDANTTLVTVLIFIILSLFFALAKIWKYNTDQNEHIKNMTVDYINRIDAMMRNYESHHGVTAAALKEVQLVLAELKGKLN